MAEQDRDDEAYDRAREAEEPWPNPMDDDRVHDARERAIWRTR